MLNSTLNQTSTSLGTIVILIGIVLSSIGILFNFIIIICFINYGKFLKHSNKNTSRRIGLLHSINTYIHLIGILSTLLIMCIRTLYGDLYLKKRDENSISWHCHFLGYLLSLFGGGVYGSCFLQAIFRFWRIIISYRGLFQNLSFHILFIFTHWIFLIILLLPILSRSIYISSDHFCLSPFDDRWTAAYISLITVIIPVTGIFIVYIKIGIYMKNHLQTRKQRKRMKNDILIIRRIFFLVIIILQTSSTGIILWILTFFSQRLHLLFYRFLRFLLILCMILCSITLLILSPQLKRALRLNRRKHSIPNPKTSSNNMEETIILKNRTISET